MNNTRPLFSRVTHSPVSLLAAIVLVALAWSSLASCGRHHAAPPGSVEICDAAKAGEYGTVSKLLKTNPDLVSTMGIDGHTPLGWAAQNGDKKMVELLLANNAPVNAAWVHSGWTPLHYAVTGASRDVVELLLANKADINAKDSLGHTPLYLAVGFGFMDVTQTLLANKADVNVRDRFGFTPLHEAVQMGQKNIVELLLASKADINARESNGHTPLDLAVSVGNKDMADFLRQHGGQDTTTTAPPVQANQSGHSVSPPPVSARFISEQQGGPPPRKTINVGLVLTNESDEPLWFVLPYYCDQPPKLAGPVEIPEGFKPTEIDENGFYTDTYYPVVKGSRGKAVQLRVIWVKNDRSFCLFRLRAHGRVEFEKYPLQIFSDSVREFKVWTADDITVNGQMGIGDWLPYDTLSSIDTFVPATEQPDDLNYSAKLPGNRDDFHKEPITRLDLTITGTWDIPIENAGGPPAPSSSPSAPASAGLGVDIVAAAKASLEDAQGKLVIASKLYERGQITTAEYETAKAKVAAAEAGLIEAGLASPAPPVPDAAAACNNNGLAKEASGDHDGAIAEFNRAIELDPKYAQAYSNRGLVKATKGDISAALGDYNVAIILDPNLAVAYFNRSAALKIEGSVPGAFYDNKRALEIAIASAGKFLATQPFADKYAKRASGCTGDRYVGVEFALLTDATGKTVGTVGFDPDTGKCVWLGENADPDETAPSESEPMPADIRVSKAFKEASKYLAMQPFAGKYAKHASSGGGDNAGHVEVEFELLSDPTGKTCGVVRVDDASGKCTWLGNKP